MRSPPSVATGLFAGRYAIEREIGQGASAIVYLARDTEVGSAVALKILRPELVESRASDRFLREIKRTSALQHPNILPVLDAGDHEGQLYFALPYMEGGTLRQLLKREKHLEMSRVLDIAKTVAEALDHAHERGLIHRDVKPENILFTGGKACLGDFGIARAIDLSGSGVTGTTSRSVVRGTPAYMSPEQAAGSQELDGRSDVFSLACVIYEMITGMQAYIGPTDEAVIAMRFVHPPRDVRVYRPVAPATLDAALQKAFAITPVDRYRKSSELIDAIEGAVRSDPTVERRPSPIRRRMIVPRPYWFAVLIGVLVVAYSVARPWLSTSSMQVVADTTRIVLLPIEREAVATAPWRDEVLMQQAFARWSDLEIVDQFLVADALRRHGRVATNEDAAEIASTLGAGRYIRSAMAPMGDRWSITASLYDVTDERALHTARASVGADLQLAAAAFARLADDLLLRGMVPDSVPGNLPSSRSLPAQQAYGQAHAALDAWDLQSADSLLQAAITFDADFARASLWLAQVRAWQAQPRKTWEVMAERAIAGQASLDRRERRLAQALRYLARDSFDSACVVYDGLAERNSRDFAAWFGRGQCRMMNKVVVADSSSPSGWRFVADAHAAMTAYATAFRILPSVHREYEQGAFERLRVLLLLTTDLISGRDASGAVFQARPGWINDSLVLVPYPWQQLAAGRAVVPPGMERALAERRTEFRRIAEGWSAAFPRSATAKQAVAMALELLQDPAAIDTIHAARALATDPAQRRRLAAMEVLLLVKFGVPSNRARLRSARALADTILQVVDEPTASDAELIGAVAAITGDCHRLLGLVGRSFTKPEFGMPASLIAEAHALHSYMAMDCDPSSAPTTIERVAGEIATRVPETDRAIAEVVLLLRPLLITDTPDPALLRRVAARSGSAIAAAAAALAKDDTAAARRHLGSAARNPDPGVPTPDMSLARALLHARLGDSATAGKVLDNTLGRAQAFDPNVLGEAAKAASFVRAMLLRVDLALSAEDPVTAERWRSAAEVLLSGADSVVRARFRRTRP